MVRTSLLRTVTNVVGGGVTVVVVAPMTETTVLVVGCPGVDTTNTVTGDPFTTVVRVRVSAVSPLSKWTVVRVCPLYAPVTVSTVCTGTGVMRAVLPTESVVAWGRGVTVAVIVMVVGIALTITTADLKAVLLANDRGSVTTVDPVLANTVVERPT